MTDRTGRAFYYANGDRRTVNRSNVEGGFKAVVIMDEAKFKMFFARAQTKDQLEEYIKSDLHTSIEADSTWRAEIKRDNAVRSCGEECTECNARRVTCRDRCQFWYQRESEACGGKALPVGVELTRLQWTRIFLMQLLVHTVNWWILSVIVWILCWCFRTVRAVWRGARAALTCASCMGVQSSRCDVTEDFSAGMMFLPDWLIRKDYNIPPHVSKQRNLVLAGR